MNDMTPPCDPFDDALAAISLRKAWAESLCYALSQCHPDDAVQIMTAALQDMLAGGPQPSLGTLAEDVDWWTIAAPDPELQAYTEAGIKRMAGRAISITARKRFIATLWNGLSDADKDAFLARFGRVTA
jgi:thiamine pyrophosphate-dependent acetolactate synthase large subunit-like protein